MTECTRIAEALERIATILNVLVMAFGALTAAYIFGDRKK